MKKALLLCLTLLAATFGFAQQQLATLNHNDSISVFYGASALQQAHAAAVNGDIITLSPGSFNSVDITKAVTIRGASMYPDTATGIGNTTLIGNFTLNIVNSTPHHLTLEGLHCPNTMYHQSVTNPQFIKCFFQSIEFGGGGDNRYMLNATFINCIIVSIPYNTNNTNAQYINSVILTMRAVGNPSLINCVAIIMVGDNNLNNMSIQNSIMCGSHSYSNPPVNARTSFNSIGLYTGTNNQFYYNATGLANHYIYNYRGYASVFKNFRGTLGDGITFELLDTVAATCLGNDGTQVGIYGGNMPFDPRVSGLNIRRLDVARRTTADGRLAVDIEVVNDESANTTEEE